MKNERSEGKSAPRKILEKEILPLNVSRKIEIPIGLGALAITVNPPAAIAPATAK